MEKIRLNMSILLLTIVKKILSIVKDQEKIAVERLATIICEAIKVFDISETYFGHAMEYN